MCSSVPDTNPSSRPIPATGGVLYLQPISLPSLDLPRPPFTPSFTRLRVQRILVEPSVRRSFLSQDPVSPVASHD
eukprot:2184480-Rhodomonas_salina.4